MKYKYRLVKMFNNTYTIKMRIKGFWGIIDGYRWVKAVDEIPSEEEGLKTIKYFTHKCEVVFEEEEY